MERRQCPRFNIVLQVETGAAMLGTTMQTGNVSENGLFLVTDNESLLAQVVPLSKVQMVMLDIDRLETLDLSGRVVRVVKGKALQSPGIAVRYDPLDDQTRARLRRFIRCARERVELDDYSLAEESVENVAVGSHSTSA